ncbi:DUF1515 domain-containing protein [Phyllobacterium zundukense]|uniref:DUF1515 domain-containing protein n=1 Tax=Phyllobacterium zundukense TaxID=1867719 RepID=A0ACD4CWY3_9HYPH|nr:DUF1515 domain-containing protein [Phyllobacterium zundukense]UXN58107.1 DUF1515 domain-containing protein [Phyllobacterium zundukense]
MRKNRCLCHHASPSGRGHFRVGGIKIDIAMIIEQVADSKIVTDKVRKSKVMELGEPGVVGIGGTALGVSPANSFDWLTQFIHR